MIDLLYTFGVGIAFSFGVFSGAVLCQLATREGRKDFIASRDELAEDIQQRVSEQVGHLGDIASSLENISELMLKRGE